MDEELQQQWFLYCPEYSGHSVLLTLAASVICPVQDFPVTQLSFPAYVSSLFFLKFVLILIAPEGPAVDAEEEAFIRAMQRKKKKKRKGLGM